MSKTSPELHEVEPLSETDDPCTSQVVNMEIKYEPPAIRVLADAACATKGSGNKSYDNTLEGYDN